jgi:transposase
MPKATINNVSLEIEIIVECTECGHKFHYDAEDGYNEMTCTNCFENIAVLVEATPYVSIVSAYNQDEKED